MSMTTKNGRPLAAPTIRHFYIIRRKNVIACRRAASLPPDCHSLRPRPPPFSPPKTRFPGKRYHEQTASPNKAQSSWRSKSHEQKRRHAHEGHTAFFGAANGIRVSRELRDLRRINASARRKFSPVRGKLKGSSAAQSSPSRGQQRRFPSGNATTNKRLLRAKRKVRGAPNPISKNTGAPVGAPVFFGAANGIRTHDLVITNDVLYRLSYSSVSNA